MTTLQQITNEIINICIQHPIMQERIEALKNSGYDNIHYVYVKHGKGLYGVVHLPKKHMYRIQIGYTELQKGYPSAWCIDVSSKDVVDHVELPF